MKVAGLVPGRARLMKYRTAIPIHTLSPWALSILSHTRKNLLKQTMDSGIKAIYIAFSTVATTYNFEPQITTNVVKQLSLWVLIISIFVYETA